MRLSDLRDAKVKTLDGHSLGRVHEVHCEDGKIVALTCGAGSLIERLTSRTHGRRIPWQCVRKIDDGTILVTPDPPQRTGRKASGSRTRRRTPRPSGQRPRR